MDEDDRWMLPGRRVSYFGVSTYYFAGPRGLFHLSLGSAEGKVQLSFELVS